MSDLIEFPRGGVSTAELKGTLSKLRSEIPCLREDWTVTDPLSKEHAVRLPSVLKILESSLKPATDKAFTAAIRLLLDWLEIYGVIELPDDDTGRITAYERIIRGYRLDIGDLPGDLLMDAILSMRRGHEYRSLPLPGDLRRLVADELQQRHADKRRVETALKTLPLRNELDPWNDIKGTNGKGHKQKLVEIRARKRQFGLGSETDVRDPYPGESERDYIAYCKSVIDGNLTKVAHQHGRRSPPDASTSREDDGPVSASQIGTDHS